MQVGDLVKHKDQRWSDFVGVVVRCIAGTDRRKVIYWNNGQSVSLSERDLEVVCKSET